MQALALSGYFVTLAISIKQTAAIYFLVFFLYLYFKTRRLKSLLFFSSSILFIGTIFALKLYTEGNLEHFLNWTVIYPSKYWTSFPGYVQLMPSPKQLVILGLLLVPTAPLAWQSIKNRQKTLILGLVFGATIAIYPRFSLFHLQPGVALMAVSTAWALSYYKDHFEHYAITYCLLVFALISLPVLQSNLGRETRFIGKSEYLSAQKIKESIGESKTLYLLGPHSAFYVFTDTLPPKPWIDNFGWYWEVPGVADDALVTWSGNPPDAIVIKTPEEGAWHDLGTYQPEILQQWIQDNYLKAKQLDPDTSLWTRIN
jgi:hypothetical protein